MELKGSWSKITGFNRSQHMHGPFIDANDNWYVVEYQRGIPYADDIIINIWKSTTSGSSWSLVGSRPFGTYSYDLIDVQQNDHMFAMFYVWDEGNWSSYHTMSQSWLMSSYTGAGGPSADGWGDVAVTSQQNAGWYSGYDAHPASLLVNPTANNFAYYICNAYNDGSYRDRPNIVTWIAGTVDTATNPLPNTPVSTYEYTTMGCTFDTNGEGIFFFRYTPDIATNHNVGWRRTDGAFNLLTSGSGYSPWPTSPQGTQSYTRPVRPTTIDSASVPAFSVRITNTILYTLTSGSFAKETIANRENTYVYSKDTYDPASAEWITVLSPANGTSDRPYQYIYKYRSTLTSGSTVWSDIPNSTVTGAYHRTHVAPNNKIYFWQSDTNDYRLYEVCDMPAFIEPPIQPVSLRASTTSGSVGDTLCYFATPSVDIVSHEWSRETGGVADLYESINEPTGTCSDYVISQYTSGSSSIYRVKLGYITAAPGGGQTIVRYGYCLADGANFQTVPSLRVSLVQLSYGNVNYGLTSMGATATASSFWSIWMLGDAAPWKMVDGDYGTVHRCADDCPTSTNLCWKQVDLGSPKTMTLLEVDFTTLGWCREWKLMRSNNETDWFDVRTVYRTSAPSGAWRESLAFTPQTARYWRMKNVQGGGGAAWESRNFDLQAYEITSRTVIASWMHTDISAGTHDEIAYLTPGQTDLVTNWNSLYFEFEQVED